MLKHFKKIITILIFALLVSAFSLQGTQDVQAAQAGGVKVSTSYAGGKYKVTLTSQEKGKGIRIIAYSPKNGKTVNITYSFVKGGKTSATAEIDEALVIAPFRVITTNSGNLNYRPYSDIINTEYDEYIRHLYDAGILAAFTEAKFKPETAVTRAEVASMFAISLNLKLDDKSKSKFSDVDKHWAKKYINAVVDKGLISGATTKTFKPDDKITVAEICAIINKTFKFKTKSQGVFTKLRKDQWYSDCVQNIFNLKILTPQDSIYKTFKETNSITRGNFAMMLSRALSTY